MADRDDEIEVPNEVELLDHKLIEAQTFDLYQHLQGYCCLWETSKSSNVKYKNRQLKEKALEYLSLKFNFTPNLFKTASAYPENSVGARGENGKGRPAEEMEDEKGEQLLFCLQTIDQSQAQDCCNDPQIA